VVAIVGAPNVGKSTLFNRMLGRRRAIVSDLPGVTRDRLAVECDLFGRKVTLVDTGGMVSGSDDDLTRRVRDEALKAVDEADVILFLMDARAGLTPLDLEVAGVLRAAKKPIIPVANKVDVPSLEGIEFEAYRLGLGEVVALSAEEGRGIDELVETVTSRVALDVRRVTLAFNPDDPADRERIARVYRHARVVQHETRDGQVSIVADVPRRLLARLGQSSHQS